MPKIPTYDQQTTAPIEQSFNLPMRAPALENPPAINPEAATSGLQASRQMTASLAQMYDTVARVGEQVSNIGEKFWNIQQASSLNKAEVATSKAMMDKLADFETRSDYQNFDPEWRQFTEKTKQDILNNTDLKGPYLDKFVNVYDSHAVSNYPKILDKTRTLAMDDYKASTLAVIEQGQRDILSATSPEAEKQIRQNITDKIDFGVTRGMLKNTDGFTLQQRLDESLDSAKGMKLILGVREGTVDPVVAKATLDNPNALMNLDPIKRVEFQKQLDVAINQRKTELKEARIDAAFSFGKEKFPGDSENAARWFEEPKNYQSLGLNVDEATHIGDIFKRQLVFENTLKDQKAQQAANDATNNYYGLYNKGRYGEAIRSLEKSAAMGIVDEKTVAQAKDMIDRKTQVGEPKDPKTPEATWVKALIGIWDGSIKDPGDLLKAGVRGDKFAQAISDIQKNQRVDTKDQLNYATSSVSKYFVDDKDLDKEQKKLKQDYVRSLKWWMDKEGLTPNDPKVGELGDKLYAPIVKEKGWLWNTQQPLYQWLGEKKPWVTGQDFKMGGIYSPNAGGVPDKAKVKIQGLLRGQGKVVSPDSVQKVWDTYGNKVFEE